MNGFRRAAWCTAVVLATQSLATQNLIAAQPKGQAPKSHAIVVALEHNASDAGLAVMKQGGNAVDAAVAVGFSLAVVLPNVGNLGGGGFMLVSLAGKPGSRADTHFLDFREKAPAAAKADMYLDAQGNILPGLSTLGYKAIGVPGSVAGLVYAQKHFGKLSLAQDMAPAIRQATDGFVMNEEEVRFLHAKNLSQFPESKRIFQRDGNFYQTGETFRQPELAATLRRIAANPDEFYRGAMARQLAAGIQAHGGLITEADLAAYTVADRKPLVGTYQGYEIVTSPPPSSGGIVLLETLNMLAGFDLAKLGPDRSSAQVQLITEAFRRAYMDRADYLGDPDYTTIPLAQMASQTYADAWRKTMVPGHPTPSRELKRPAGFLPPPPAIASQGEGTQTTHFSVMDEAGNAVSMTYTLNGYYGCGATAEGLGFVLNNEMDDFSSKPGTPNMFGLVQGPANAIGPGHRPLSSMTPTLVFKNGKVRLVLGSPGGSTIITTVANDLISVLTNGLDVQAAADAPRFHHQYLPDVLDFEKAFPTPVVEALKGMGYTVSQAQAADAKSPGVWGDSEMIYVDPMTGAYVGADDKRHTMGKVSQY